MSKVHLIHENTSACSDILYVSVIGGCGTHDHNQVTCKSCEKTNEYKRLKAEADQKLKDEVMSIKDEVMQEKKVHLYEPYYTNNCACNPTTLNAKYTLELEDVTCLSCKSSKPYKHLVREFAKQEAQEILEKVENKVMQEKTCENCANAVGEEECAIDTRYDTDKNGDCDDWVSGDNLGDEPKNYKQKIEIDIPCGYDFVRLGESEIGDYYLDNKGEVTKHIASGWFPYELKVIVKPKAKTGAELIGIVCVVSDVSIDDCVKKLDNLVNVSVVTDYRNGIYFCGSLTWKYAYPVPADKLKELLRNLES